MRLLIWSLFAMCAVQLSGAATLQEDFSTDPTARGWSVFGNTNLFAWNSTNQNLEVTWDSSTTNSYFHHSLGTLLTTNDEFSLQFDLRLDDAEIGGFGFEIALGLLNFADATNASFLRGTGHNSPNLAEFDYYPDFGFGPSIDGTLVDSTATNFHFFYVNLPLEFGTVYHVAMQHAANTTLLSVELSTDEGYYTDLPIAYSTAAFLDFRMDAISVSSYSDARSNGSILAHGIVDNLIVTYPSPPIENLFGQFSNGAWRVDFLSASNWVYTLERTTNFQVWSDVSTATPGNGTNLMLMDTNALPGEAFYRVRAERP